MAAEQAGIHISLAPYHLGEVWGLPITASLTTAWLAAGLIIIFALLFRRGIKEVPGRLQSVVEVAVLGVYDYVKGVLEDEVLARRYFPLIMSIFLFIAVGNLLGLLPFVGGSIGFEDPTGEHHGLIPLFYPINTDLNLTLAMAIVAFIAIEFAGIAALGVLKYASKFVNLHSALGFIVGIIELVSEVARLITFSFRLFGNIFAGKVLILVAMFFLPYILPVPLLLYEVLVGVIQGAVFALLTLFFIKIAVTEPH